MFDNNKTLIKSLPELECYKYVFKTTVLGRRGAGHWIGEQLEPNIERLRNILKQLKFIVTQEILFKKLFALYSTYIQVPKIYRKNLNQDFKPFNQEVFHLLQRTFDTEMAFTGNNTVSSRRLSSQKLWSILENYYIFFRVANFLGKRINRYFQEHAWNCRRIFKAYESRCSIIYKSASKFFSIVGFDSALEDMRVFINSLPESPAYKDFIEQCFILAQIASSNCLCADVMYRIFQFLPFDKSLDPNKVDTLAYVLIYKYSFFKEHLPQKRVATIGYTFSGKQGMQFFIRNSKGNLNQPAIKFRC